MERPGHNPFRTVMRLGTRRTLRMPDVRRRLCAAFKICRGRPRAITPTPWACCDLHFRLPVTDCNAPGTASMALTNAEKQARYRERHLENGTKTRGHFILEATTKAKLLRLAHHRNFILLSRGEEPADRRRRLNPWETRRSIAGDLAQGSLRRRLQRARPCRRQAMDRPRGCEPWEGPPQRRRPRRKPEFAWNAPSRMNEPIWHSRRHNGTRRDT
jgi:hypothetical protein